ncbi:MAG: hypothetical protein LBK66_09060 [Spirochaetaceae bacterium]|nr:hypothetical protein [Spirochaetaceae bacterium]
MEAHALRASTHQWVFQDLTPLTAAIDSKASPPANGANKFALAARR